MSSTSTIVKLFAKDTFLPGAKPKDSVVERVLSRLGAVKFIKQVAIAFTLEKKLDIAFSNLQKIGQAIGKVDPKSTTAVKEEESQLQAKRKQSLAEFKETQEKTVAEGRNILKILNPAPITEEVFPQVSNRVLKVEEKTEELTHTADTEVVQAERAQLKYLDNYKKLLSNNSTEEGQNNTHLQTLFDLEKSISLSRTRTKEATSTQPKKHAPGG